jgi:geranylgeranyl reductase family protein
MTGAAALVVGAGPAGSIAALLLARAGVAVRILDRATFPRNKLCGDTINPGSLAILDRLGLGARVRARIRPITGMTVTGPRGTCVSADYPGHLVAGAVLRRDFDLALLDAAIAAGADFIPEAHVHAPVLSGNRVTGIVVQHGGRRETVAARVVIAADGRGSRLGSALGLTAFAAAPRRWAFGAYFTNVADLTSHGEMHVRRDEYIGVAPVTDELTNVCVVHEVHAGRALTARQDDPDRKGPRRMDDEVTRAIASDPILRERFADARQVTPITTLGPLAVNARAAGCPGLLLAGDAAGFVDPMTGDGLRFALRGGELAAEAALVELASGSPGYARLREARHRAFAGKWRVNRALRSLVGSPRGVGVAAALTTYWPAPVRYLVGVAGDIKLACELTN